MSGRKILMNGGNHFFRSSEGHVASSNRFSSNLGLSDAMGWIFYNYLASWYVATRLPTRGLWSTGITRSNITWIYPVKTRSMPLVIIRFLHFIYFFFILDDVYILTFKVTFDDKILFIQILYRNVCVGTLAIRLWA